MEENKLSTIAELNAEKAENLRAFSGLKLLHVKTQLASILGMIGREGIFDEYTKHDISHINYMLESLDWIIPKETQEIMTPADWLMIVLSVYFHDLGMLVTKDEFGKRQSLAAFKTFKNEIHACKYGAEYKDKIDNLDDGERERFIYQELVRKTHAERVKYWILGEKSLQFDRDIAVVEQIQKLIANLDYTFRRDLAMICESHHLSDLDNFEKYKINQPYGTTNTEIVNLHYAALILRTADLLHITSDRTPSIEYHLINPSDPISQEEWAKQMAVRNIRPKAKKNKEGKVDENIAKDTLEVFAYFQDEKGFFGLISYLNYANEELIKNKKYNELAKKNQGCIYDYPWKAIDDSNIETKDFEKKQFEFSLDQPKILNLLVGHTLYNDSTVVLRELIQNGIDATKLVQHEHSTTHSQSRYDPSIYIDWNEKKKTLSFLDNGTGMTLEIIQNHLLKVGSSRYQDDAFKKKYPDFSPISRFGIGLLTCFLVADNIDITTKSKDSEKAILLKINKVHGKYLLKYIHPDELQGKIKQHGTQITLHVRSDVRLDGIERDIKKWVPLSQGEMILNNNGIETNIGHRTPSDALQNHLTSLGYTLQDDTIKVLELEDNGVSMAVAVRFIEPFHEWEFLEINRDEEDTYPVGTCIEGIRVDFNTPGFLTKNIYALINTVGKNAPKTNVARSNIELTPEKENTLYSIYKLYLTHLHNELENLRKKGFSLSWAVKEFNWLLDSFARDSYRRRHYSHQLTVFENKRIFDRALADIKCVLIERNNIRDLVSINELKEINHFWTIESASYLSADSLIKEVKSTEISALSLLQTAHVKEDPKVNHIDILLCKIQAYHTIDKIILDQFEVSDIKIIPEQRRIDFNWKHSEEKNWEVITILNDTDYGSEKSEVIYIQTKEIGFENTIQYTAINSSNGLYILLNSDLSKYINKMLMLLNNKGKEEEMALNIILRTISAFFYNRFTSKTIVEETINYILERSDTRNVSKAVWDRIDKTELTTIILKSDLSVFDTTIWERRSSFV